jgi:hypothetical protein
MELLKRNLETGAIEVEPLLIYTEPFKSIYKKDRTHEKNSAFSIFTYIWYAEDVESPLRNKYYKNHPNLLKEAAEKAGVTQETIKKYEVDKAREAYYEMFLPSEIKDYDAGLKKLEQLIKFLKDLDLNERDKSNKLVHNTRAVMQDITAIPEYVQKLKEARHLALKAQKKVLQKGNTIINAFEPRGPVSKRY